jgi:hypothetical protein
MERLPKIVQQRLQATAPPGVHPDPDLLTAFAEKSLTERERVQVLQHLGQCADCRQVVALAMPESRFTTSDGKARSAWLLDQLRRRQRRLLPGPSPFKARFRNNSIRNWRQKFRLPHHSSRIATN